MMSAAVHGSLFASPGPATILSALRAIGHNHPGGFELLGIIIQYDVMMFNIFLAADS